MKINLFDFQKDALHQLRDKVTAASRMASSDNPQAVAFTAPTGSGKTIVMTALFEAILVGPDDQLGWPHTWAPQPDAVILWISDMPELNEQTRMKIEQTSDRVNRVRQLVVIDSNFDAEVLSGGRIYFVNTQKLGSDKRLTRTGDGRQFSIWETLSNTARAIPDRFYVVIDEAHRGMSGGRGAAEAKTLMQRFLLGHPESGLIKMPLVLGISATPKRFTDLLLHAPHTLHKVNIDAADVRSSGLLKDRVLIHHPKGARAAEMTLLGEAALQWLSMTRTWAEYCNAEEEQTVWPILVVQVENGTERVLTRTSLSDAIAVIEKAIGRRLLEGEVAHSFHDSGDLDVAGRRVRRVDASRIEEDNSIGVVFFKTNLSTGWDCPRAEVMMSFRRAEDHTYIAQLLGRMVRTPLARRIERVAELNDVHLFLPLFDEDAVDTVISDLHNVEEFPPAETGSSRDLVVLRRRNGSEEIFSQMDRLVTYRVNAARAQSHIRRYVSLARALTIDGIGKDEWKEAKATATIWMSEHIQSLKSAGSYEAASELVTKIAVRSLAVSPGSPSGAPGDDYLLEASPVDIDRLFEEAGRAFGNGLHMEYWQANEKRDSYDVKVEVIVLARDHAFMAAMESKAEERFDQLYDKYKKSIGKLKAQKLSHYEKLRLASSKPKDIPWHLPDSIDFTRSPGDPLWKGHLYVDADGKFRANLGTWEADVLREELSHPNFASWLRNVDRKGWSLEIPYQAGGDERPFYPDLLVIRKSDNTYSFDILDPHDPSLGDSYEKAIGLARFAERHGDRFGRIELIRKVHSTSGDRIVRLNVNSEPVRKRVALITTNRQLDDLFKQHATSM